jgi:hypothetical protein
MGPESETGDGGRKPVRGRIANAKVLGWLIYAAGVAIWLFGYLSAGHAPVFDWNAATPWWISSFVPNLEAELGLALMFASTIPTLPLGSLIPIRGPSSRRGRDPRVVRVFGVADLAYDLGDSREVTMRKPLGWTVQESTFPGGAKIRPDAGNTRLRCLKAKAC